MFDNLNPFPQNKLLFNGTYEYRMAENKAINRDSEIIVRSSVERVKRNQICEPHGNSLLSFKPDTHFETDLK